MVGLLRALYLFIGKILSKIDPAHRKSVNMSRSLVLPQIKMYVFRRPDPRQKLEMRNIDNIITREDIKDWIFQNTLVGKLTVVIRTAATTKVWIITENRMSEEQQEAMRKISWVTYGYQFVTGNDVYEEISIQ